MRASFWKGAAMNMLVTDRGFAADDWQGGFLAPADLAAALGQNAVALDLEGGFDVAALLPFLDGIDLIRIRFVSFTDGRGFSQARHLRLIGYAGRLRAVGEVLPDQYVLIRRSGFDEVEIDAARAARQPEAQWQAQNRQLPDYQQRLRHFA